MKINIKDKKLGIDKQKQDIATYGSMINELVKKINGAGLRMSWIGAGESSQKQKNNLEVSVQVTPMNLREDSQLVMLDIDVYNEKALNIVKTVLGNYSNKYHHLDEVNISTYF